VPSTQVIVPPLLPPAAEVDAAPLELALDDELLLDPLLPQAAMTSAATAMSSMAATDLTYLFT
jgi:hypothetical protein